MQAVNECLLKFILDSLPGKPPSACVSFKVMMHGCLCVCECVYAYLSLITSLCPWDLQIILRRLLLRHVL